MNCHSSLWLFAPLEEETTRCVGASPWYILYIKVNAPTCLLWVSGWSYVSGIAVILAVLWIASSQPSDVSEVATQTEKTSSLIKSVLGVIYMKIEIDFSISLITNMISKSKMKLQLIRMLVKRHQHPLTCACFLASP